jgi:hypothetical protein
MLALNSLSHNSICEFWWIERRVDWARKTPFSMISRAHGAVPLYQNYALDIVTLRFGKVDDGGCSIPEHSAGRFGLKPPRKLEENKTMSAITEAWVWAVSRKRPYRLVYCSRATYRNGLMTMTSIKTIAAAALLSTLAISPVFAQAAHSEPGEYSFYHPDRDVLNGGAPIWGSRAAPAPYSDSQAYYLPTEDSVVVHHFRRHHVAHPAH